MMKRYVALFAVMAGLSAVNASVVEERKQEGEWSHKKCFKACMKQIDDREKCEYICDPVIDPKK